LNYSRAYRIAGLIPVFGVGLSLVSCENDLTEIRIVTATDDTPDEIVNGLHTVYSDSGIVKYEIIATRTESYSRPERKTLFKNGFEVRFYKYQDSLVSRLTAEYAEMRQDHNKVIARNNIIFTNYERKKTLKTEELHWDQATRQFSTDKRFVVEGADIFATGIGMHCDEAFDDYQAHDAHVEYDIETKDTLQ
jgi:LPS export ABC transporter protein LptC